jgi:hypothetical protein
VGQELQNFTSKLRVEKIVDQNLQAVQFLGCTILIIAQVTHHIGCTVPHLASVIVEEGLSLIQ